MLQKEVEYSLINGPPNFVIETLNRTLGQFKRYHRKVKIGITGRNPQTRFNEHLRYFKWDRMVVVYETSSINFANKIEEWLVDCHWDFVTNRRIGGGSKLSEKFYSYTYVLLKK
ncbi:MAG: hypothetical protein NTV31_15510 [Bacteroidia bacterium]|nr:hypothetical protein [Bacteroidia bacterium]